MRLIDTNPELESLIQGYVEGQLTPGECSRLQAMLEGDASLVDVVLNSIQTDELLRRTVTEMHLELAPSRMGVAPKAARLPRRRWGGMKPAGRRPALAWGAAFAAGFAVLLGVLGWFVQPSDALIVASFTGTSPRSSLSGATQPVAVGHRLRPGELLTTEPDSRMTLRYEREATEFQFLGRTSVQWLSTRHGRQFNLIQGRLTAKVAPQPAREPMIWRTPHNQAEVIGTEFVLATSSTATQLDVAQGLIRLTGSERGTPLSVAAGQYAVTAAGIALEAHGTPRPSHADERGAILREWWDRLPGVAVAELTASTRYPARPTGEELLSRFEAPFNWGENYGSRVRGLLHPAVGGDYTFWIAGDDGVELWLSQSESSENKRKIASSSAWTEPRNWDKQDSQRSLPVRLEAGRAYFIEALHKQGEAGDCLAVAWQPPGQTREVIPGTFLSPPKPQP